VDLVAPALDLVETGFATRCNNDHGISPDGSQIILSSHRENGAEIFLMPATGGVPEVISPKAPSWWHSWSQVGKAIAYAAVRGEGRVVDICRMELETRAETRLTFGEGHSDGPEFSADGALIYYNCDRDGPAQIWVMQADGSDPRKLFADDHVNWFPHPSPDGRHLLYLAYPPGTRNHPANLNVALCLSDPDGQNRRRVVEMIGGQGSINVPCWAPDSSAFAYIRYQPD
jgi:Tol biopolymer transport system component